MMHPTLAGIGLVRLGDSGFVPVNMEDDLCGKDAHDPHEQRMGRVEELYVDRQKREVRYLEVGSGGFLGIGEGHFLVPVEAVTRVSEARVTVEPDRTEKVDGPAPFDNKVRPPTVDDRRNDDHASPPVFGNATRPINRPVASPKVIHPSSWKGCSANFALRVPSEVRAQGGLRKSTE